LVSAGIPLDTLELPMIDDRITRLERGLRRVTLYAAGLTLALAALLVTAFRQQPRTRYAVLDVERLNIVEKDGKVRLAIANSERMPPITFYGREYPGLRGGSAPGGAGMVYFNDEGTENGGYIWHGKRLPDGTYRAAGFLTFDQYNQDEALTLGYLDSNGERRAGLTVIDEPNSSIQPLLDSIMVFRNLPDSAERDRRNRALRQRMAESGEVRADRVFVGKDRSRSAIVSLADPKGRPRLRLTVDSLGTARLEFLDESGKVTSRMP
jgi:hypothetical protein